jgi:RHH-type transcriptional regulator, rel operon repressor / antitoxin RelB
VEEVMEGLLLRSGIVLQAALLNLFNRAGVEMLGVRLEPELEARLESLAKATGRSKSFYAKEAIRQYIEDREDSLLADKVLRRNEPVFTLEEVKRELGLDN